MRWIRRAITASLAGAAVALCLAGCGSSNEPKKYSIMISETSGNLYPGSGGQLFAYWTCDPSAIEYHYGSPIRWTKVDGQKGLSLLRTEASCPHGSLLTVDVDAGVAQLGNRPTRLRCEVFNDSAERVDDETVERAPGAENPTCRVPVPS